MKKNIVFWSVLSAAICLTGCGTNSTAQKTSAVITPATTLAASSAVSSEMNSAVTTEAAKMTESTASSVSFSTIAQMQTTTVSKSTASSAAITKTRVSTAASVKTAAATSNTYGFYAYTEPPLEGAAFIAVSDLEGNWDCDN